jgi:glutaredoxin
MIKRVSIVLAYYCPHCVPFSLQNAKKIAKELCVQLRILDIEKSEQEKVADKLVKENGDWSEDYLIPQVFIEHIDGRVDHILTGFSEAVAVTEASWLSLFSSSYYKNLVHQQKFMKSKSLQKFVDEYLNFKGQCRRHCNKPASTVELLSDFKKTVRAYVCPEGYVSRIIYFSINPDITWFKRYLSNQIDGSMLKDRDIRPATRYGWELKKGASNEIKEVSSTGIIKEVYWTVYPKTDEEKELGIFLCSDQQKGKGCRKLFVQKITSTKRLCFECR